MTFLESMLQWIGQDTQRGNIYVVHSHHVHDELATVIEPTKRQWVSLGGTARRGFGCPRRSTKRFAPLNETKLVEALRRIVKVGK